MYYKNTEKPAAAAVDGFEFKFFTDREVAAQLGVARRSVFRFVKSGILPPPVHLGRLARWHAQDLLAAIEAMRERDKKPVRRGRPTREEEATAAQLGIDVPALRARRAGGAA